MPLHDEIPILGPALKTGTGVKSVTDEWPKKAAALPCITIHEASNLPDEFYDSAEYSTELEYYIRVWARTRAETSRIASLVEDVMTRLHYVRNLTYDDDSADIKQKAMRYRKYL